jgi:hypothetical protein
VEKLAGWKGREGKGKQKRNEILLVFSKYAMLYTI